MISLSDYSFKATRSIRGAMASTLAERLRALEFTDPTGFRFRFAEVFEDWPSYSSKYVPPSACVLPGSWTYADALMTPTLLEDTWEPHGEAGFGLYKLSEVEVDFEVSLRTDSAAQRDDVMLGLEEAFQSPGLLMDHDIGARYGVLIEMLDYYKQCVRFALQGARMIDGEDAAMREHRDAVFTIRGIAPQVKIGPVQPFKAIVRLDPDC